MAAPTPTARATPVGRKLKEGFPVKITIAADTDISFWEKSVTPVGFDGGDSIDQSTMFNTRYRTKAARTLIDTTDGSGIVAFDPAVLDQIEDIINLETTITYTFRDGSTWAVYGYLKSFTPGEQVEGEQPEADIEIVHTNYDNSGNAEAGPAVASVAGT